MKKLTTARILGFYLLLAACWELAACYSNKVSVFLLPRTGWAMLVGKLKPVGNFAVEFPEAVSAGWLLMLGALLLCGRRPVKTYIVSEGLLALPTLLFVILLFASGGGHVIKMADGFKMLFESLVFTFVPLLLAIRILIETPTSGTSAATGTPL